MLPISEQEEQNFENLAKLAREQNRPKGGITLGATKNGVCKMFLHSTCNNFECGFLHDTSRVQPCQNYANNLCKFGDACEFNHQLNLVPVKTCNNMRHQGYCEKTECKFKHLLYTCLGFDKGYCPDGKHCIKAHVRKELCKNYMYGFCPEGPNCLYAHPKLLMDWDAKFFHEIDPKIRVIKCNKCNILGHKANNCLSRKTVEIVNTCPNCNCWHWKDNPCPYEPEEPSMPIESLGDGKLQQQQQIPQ